MTKAIRKDDLLNRWASMKTQKNPASVMRAIENKHEGSTYGNDGIRIDGSQEFIFAVLSRLTPLMDLENGTTRLQLSMSPVRERVNGEFGGETGEWCCYIRCHERGPQAQVVNAFMSAVSKS